MKKILLILILVSLAFSETKPTSLAVINLRGETELNLFINHLSFGLFQEPNLTVVERQHIDDLMGEYLLAASGAVLEESAVELGRVLGAEGMLLINLEENRKFLRIRVDATELGLRLYDEQIPWDMNKMKEIRTEVFEHIVAAVQKIRNRDEKQLYVGILSLRNTGISGDISWLETSFPKILSKKLINEKHITVLEREDLLRLLTEKEIMDNFPGKFQNSLLILEGSVEQVAEGSGSKEVVLKFLILSNEQALSEKFEFRANSLNPETLADTTARWIGEMMKQPVLTDHWQAKSEASKYFSEAKVIWSNSSAALPLVNAALALNPMEKSHAHHYLYLISEKYLNSSTMEGAQAFRDYIQIIERQHRLHGEMFWLRLSSAVHYLNSRFAIEKEDVRSYNKDTRRLLKQLLERNEMPKCATFQVDMLTAVAKDEKDQIKLWSTFLKKEVIRSTEPNQEGCWRSKLYQAFISVPGGFKWEYDRFDKKILDREIEKLYRSYLKNPDPVVRLFAESGLARQLNNRESLNKEFVKNHCENVLDIYQNGLNDSGWSISERGEEQMKSIVKNLYSKILDTTLFKESDPFATTHFEEKLLFDALRDLPDSLSENSRIMGNHPGATVTGDTLWVASIPYLGNRLSEVWLLAFDLKSRKLLKRWSVSFPQQFGFPSLENNRPFVTNNAVYLGIRNVGVAVFQRKKGDDFIITKNGGLPSANISSLAVVEDRLFVAFGREYEDSGLGYFDLKKKSWTTISTSRSRDRSCALNREQMYHILDLTPSPNRKEIFFLLNQNGTDISGLWRMDLNGGNIKRLMRIQSRSPFAMFRIEPNEKMWRIFCQSGIILSFDPENIKTEVLVCDRYDDYRVFKPLTPNSCQLAEKNWKIPRLVSFDYGSSRCIYKGNLIVFDSKKNWILPLGKDTQLEASYVTWESLDTSRIYEAVSTPYGIAALTKNKISLIDTF